MAGARQKGSSQDRAGEDMPFLPDGTPIEICLNPSACLRA